MAVIKIACPKCGQKVSGDETFYGRSVNCPICTSKIVFPENPDVPDLDALVASESFPTGPSFDPAPPASPSTPGFPEPSAFEPAAPSNQAYPTPPGFDTLAPSHQPARPASGPEELQFPSDRELPPVPRAPEIPADDRDEEVPSPLLGAVSLVVGILNTVTSCVIGPLLAPVAIIVGHTALARAKHSPVQPAPGQSLAMIGVILGYAGLVFTIIGLIVLLAFKQPLMELLNHGSSPGA